MNNFAMSKNTEAGGTVSVLEIYDGNLVITGYIEVEDGATRSSLIKFSPGAVSILAECLDEYLKSKK